MFLRTAMTSGSTASRITLGMRTRTRTRTLKIWLYNLLTTKTQSTWKCTREQREWHLRRRRRFSCVFANMLMGKCWLILLGKGVFKFKLEKANKGEHFDGLELITKLLTPETSSSHNKPTAPLIEELDAKGLNTPDTAWKSLLRWRWKHSI